MTDGGGCRGVGSSGGSVCWVSGRCRCGDGVDGVPEVGVWVLLVEGIDTSDGRGAGAAHSSLCDVVVLAWECALLWAHSSLFVVVVLAGECALLWGTKMRGWSWHCWGSCGGAICRTSSK